MIDHPCPHEASQALADYLAGELAPEDEAAFEDHLFSCEDCTRRLEELQPLVEGIRQVAGAALVGGLVTDDVLNRWARDGVRIRQYALSPGEVVPCAVWEGDDMMVVRLRGDFTGASTVSIVRRISSSEEASRASDIPVPDARAEIIYATPAALVRELPSVDIELTVRAGSGGAERMIGTYTLRHTAAPTGCS